jgi:riboflavin kinase / FMN adenylyltransferase
LVVRFNGLADVPDDWPRSVVTIGVFDGVHAGHRAVIQVARNTAENLGRELPLPVVAITFDPHPMAVVRPDAQPASISTVDQRVDLLTEAGCDAVLVLPFTKDLSSLSPGDFAEQVLAGRLHAQAIVVGENFRFGNRASGSVGTLRDLGERFDWHVEGLPLVGDADASWSSTYVRERIAEGDVGSAAQALGRPHRVEGVVVHGDHRGRELGFPTANLEPVAHAAVPGDGVYASWLVRRPNGDEERFPAAISIGTNPTFDGVQQRIEAYVLDRDDLDLYGEHVAFEFVERLRPTLKFDGIEPLIAQMHDDVARARDVLDL